MTNTELVGMYFIAYDRTNKITGQGQVIGREEGNFLLCRTYDGLTGATCVRMIGTWEALDWRFFENAEDWQNVLNVAMGV